MKRLLFTVLASLAFFGQAAALTFNQTCNSTTTGNYSCAVQSLPPEPGYTEMVRVDGPSKDYPIYIIKMRQNRTADVFVSLDFGPFRFAGVWVETGRRGNCIAPKPQQIPDARDFLGQDAWDLCIR